MNTQFKVSVFWDNRNKLKGNMGTVMLQPTINRQRFYFSLKLLCTKVNYEKAMTGRMLNPEQKKLREDINSCIMKAEELLSRLNEPTKESFIRFYKSDLNLSIGSKVDCYSLMKAKIAVLEAEERFGTAQNLNASFHSFKTFKNELYLEDISESFIKGYKDFMIKRKCSSTTTGMYLRNLRAVYNQAISDGLISGSVKPFKNITLGSSVKSKSVLYPYQLKQLWEYRSESLRETRAIAFFFFSYLCNGMNFKDVAYLKWKNINGDILSFVREKTKNTKRNESEIRVYLCDEAKKIIAIWGSKKRKPDDYIFEFMRKYRSPKHFEDTIIRYKRICNKALVKIGKELGFDVHLVLGLARHSFATKLKLDGTPVSFISEAMGHSSMSTTQHYLKSLPDENLRLMNSKLLAF